MKITAQEEYGLRILLRIAHVKNSEGLSIPQISDSEGLSQHYVAKLCRMLRLSGYINSTRGKEGGYTLALSSGEIKIKEVLNMLGGKLYSPNFCANHTGNLVCCSHSVDCSVRSLWQIVQQSVDQVLDSLTLKDLTGPEEQVKNGFMNSVQEKTSAENSLKTG